MRPLRPAWVRAIIGLAPCAALGAVFAVAAGLRPDLDTLGVLAGHGVTVAFAVAACGLTVLLLRESVPGARPPVVLGLTAVIAVVAARLVTSTAVHAAHPFPVESGQELRLTLICSAAVAVFGLPWLVAAIVLFRRGFPSTVALPAVLGGVAAVIGGEAFWRLHCPYTSPAHVIGSHLPPIALFAAAWLLWKPARSRAA